MYTDGGEECGHLPADHEAEISPGLLVTLNSLYPQTVFLCVAILSKSFVGILIRVSI